MTSNLWNPNCSNRIRVSDNNGDFIWVDRQYVAGIQNIDCCNNIVYKTTCLKESYIPPYSTNCNSYTTNSNSRQCYTKRLNITRPGKKKKIVGCFTKVLPTNKACVSSGAAMSQGEYVSSRYLTRLGTPKSNNPEDQNPLPQGKICYNSNTWIGCSTSNITTVEDQINILGYRTPHFPPNVNNKHCAIKYNDVISAIKAGLYTELGCRN